jgi:hypothetical protein
MRIMAVMAVVSLSACAARPAGGGATPVEGPVHTSVTTGMGETLAFDTYPSRGARVFNTPVAPDQVYGALQQVFPELGITVGTVQPESRTLGNTRLILNRKIGDRPLSQMLECGATGAGTPIADAYRVEMSLITTVLPRGTGSEVQTRLEASAANPSVAGGRVACATTGQLEQLIATRTQVRLAQGGTSG